MKTRLLAAALLLCALAACDPRASCRKDQQTLEGICTQLQQIKTDSLKTSLRSQRDEVIKRMKDTPCDIAYPSPCN